jgi:hypothetical protein
MALLDRFRTRPAWQHPDPAVRAEAARHLGASDHDTLVSLVRSDPEAVVRKAAVRRLSDVAVIVEIARADADASVREEAASLLGRFAGDADASAAATAFAALEDARSFASLARGAKRPEIRQAALAKVSDGRALVSLAKMAEDPTVRISALERVHEAAALAEVALKTEHKDAGLAALARVQDEAALREIAARARHRSVARRARERFEALAGTAKPVTAEDARGRAIEACRTLEGLADSHDWGRLGEALDEARDDWENLAPSVDAETARRFAAGAEVLDRRLAEHRAQEAVRREEQEAHAAAVAVRVPLCERLEALVGDDAPARLEAARAEWGALPALEGTEAAELAARFERAAVACGERHTRWLADGERREKLEGLARDLEAAATAAAGPDHEKLHALRRDWNRLLSGGPVPPETKARAEVALSHLAEHDRKAREEREQKAKQGLARLTGLCDRAEALAKAEAPALRDADHVLRDIRSALGDPGPIANRKDRDAILERLKAARSLLYPRVQELREAEEWKRWANVAVQEELCARVEALVAVTDMDKAAAELHELQGRWRQFSQARKEEAAGLSERFRAARDQVQGKVEEHLRKRAAEEQENLTRKQALCVQAETLAASTDWLKTAEAVKALQAEWKTIGPAPHRQQKALWDRFHGACDRFFTSRKQDLSRRKDEWSKNLERKEALCAEAEALAASTDWDKAAAEIKRLQAEWKAIGPVRRSRSEAIWQRFRAACDAFFERFKKRAEIENEALAATREALCAEIEALLPAPPAEGAEPAAAPDKLAETVQSLTTKWRQAPALSHERGARLNERFYGARDRLIAAFGAAFKGSELDPDANSGRREKLIGRVLGVLRSLEAAGQGPEVPLAERLKEALATNSMGGRAAVEARWRAAAEEVDSAQAAWKRIGPVPGDAGRELADRFRKACDRFHAMKPR